MDEAWFKDFMKDVARGDAARFLKQQRPPQARWARPDTLCGIAALTYDPAKPDGKVLVGALGDHLIGIKDDRHVLTGAGSRSGKSVCLVSNLCFYDGSVLATDPKGELARLTAKRRAIKGQTFAGNAGVMQFFGNNDLTTCEYVSKRRRS